MIIEETIDDAELVRRLSDQPDLEELRLEDGRSLSAKGLAELTRQTGLRRLTIARVKRAVDTVVAKLVGALELEELSVRQCNKLSKKGLAAIAASPTIRRLDVGSTQLQDADFKLLAKMSRLEALSIRSCSKVTQRGFANIATVQSLRSLDAESCEMMVIIKPRIKAKAIAHLAKLPQLEELNLTNNDALDDDALREVARISSLRRLDAARLDETTRAGWLALAELELERLRVFSSEGVDDSVAAALSLRQGLRELDLEGTEVTDEGVKKLARSETLETLALWGDEVTDEGVTALATMPQLRQLRLSHCAITPACLEQLVRCPLLERLGLPFDEGWDAAAVRNACARMPALTTLEVVATQAEALTDAALRELLQLPALGHLVLRASDRITPDGLNELRGLPSLRSIEVTACPNLSQEDADAALEARP